MSIVICKKRNEFLKQANISEIKIIFVIVDIIYITLTNGLTILEMVVVLVKKSTESAIYFLNFFNRIKLPIIVIITLLDNSMRKFNDL